MKKVLMIVLALLIAFAIIRIATSTYENIKRNNNANMSTFDKYNFLILT